LKINWKCFKLNTYKRIENTLEKYSPLGATTHWSFRKIRLLN
jgi:hypothetical protein